MTFPLSDTHSPRGPPPDRQQSYKYYASKASHSRSPSYAHSHQSRQSPSFASSHARGDSSQSARSDGSMVSDVEQGRNGPSANAVIQEVEDDGGWTVDWETPTFVQVGGQMKRTKNRGLRESVQASASLETAHSTPTSYTAHHQPVPEPGIIPQPALASEISSAKTAWEDIADTPLQQVTPLPLSGDLQKEDGGWTIDASEEMASSLASEKQQNIRERGVRNKAPSGTPTAIAPLERAATDDHVVDGGWVVDGPRTLPRPHPASSPLGHVRTTGESVEEYGQRQHGRHITIAVRANKEVERAKTPVHLDGPGDNKASEAADGGWTVDDTPTARPSQVVHRQVEGGEEGAGWSRNDEASSPPDTHSPRQVRTIPSASAAIRNWLGSTVASPHPDLDPHQGHGHGSQYIAPIEGSMPPHVRHASMRDPNRDPIANTRAWGAVSPIDERQADVPVAFSTLQESPATPTFDKGDGYGKDDGIATPALTFSPFSPTGVPEFDKLDLKQAADANAAAAAATAAAASKSGGTAEGNAGAGDDDGGWSSDAAVKRWAQSVDATLPPPPEPIIESDPEEPPKRRSPSVALTIKTGREEVPSRPSSVAPRPPPITQYISDDESEDDSPLPTPKIGDRFDQPKESPTIVNARREDQHQNLPYHADARTEIKTASAFGDSETTETRRDRQYRSQRQHRERDKSSVYWKRDPHPAFSPRYAAHRVSVNVRIANLVTMLTDHMSRYGSIRMIWTVDAKGDGADTALAIFDEPESVAVFMASKDRNICISRSSNRAGTTEFSIETSIPPPTLTAKTVYIKVTGERGDGRSRSASPSLERSQGARADQREYRLRPLPLGVHIDAVPQINRRKGNIEYYARIRPAHVQLEDVQQRALYETNQSARELFYVDLGRRVQEKDFIPRLADYFAEIVDVVPPRNKDQGWLISVGGTGYARALMSEMSKISGITVRWARRDDEHEQQDGGNAPSEAPGVEASPSSRFGELAADVEQHNGGRRLFETGSEMSLSALSPRPESNEPVSIAARLEAQVDESGWPVRNDTPSVPTIKLDDVEALSTSAEHRAEPPVDADQPHQITLAGPGAAGNVQTGQSSNDNAQSGNALPGNPGPSQQNGANAQNPNGNDGDDDPRQPFGGGGHGQGQGGAYPSFTRRLEYTYRGRILRMDDSGAAPRYYDDAGVFVGRLCQSREDRHTLFARFSKYGFICDIEYKVVSTSAYGSARILFGDVASAQRALRHEMGETDYGSVLKIDKRRVLPADVEMRECMIDDFGRAYSPTMAEQWSPPRPYGHHLGATVPPEFPRPAQAARNGPAVPHDHAVDGRAPLSLQLNMPDMLPHASTPPMQGQWSGVLQPAAANGTDAIHQISLELGVRYWPGDGAPPPLQPGPIMLPSPPRIHAVPLSPVPPVPSHVQQDPMLATPVMPVLPGHQQQDTRGERLDVAAWPPTQATPAPTDSRTPHRQIKAQSSGPDRGGGGPEHGMMEQATPITAPQPNTADAGPLSAPALAAQCTEEPDSAATRSTVATAGSAEPVFPRLPSPERKTGRDDEGDTGRPPSLPPRTTSPVRRSSAGSLNSSTSSAHGSQNGLEVKDKFVTASGLHKSWYDPDQLAAFRAENGLPPIAVPGRSRDTTVTPATVTQQDGHVNAAYAQGTSEQHPTPQSQTQMQYIDPDAQVAITPSRPFASLSASSSSRSHSSNHSVDHPYQLEPPQRPFQQVRTSAVPIPFVEQMPLARPPPGVPGHAAHPPAHAGQNSFAPVPPFEPPMMQPPYVPSHGHLAQQGHRGPSHIGVPQPSPLQPPYAPAQTNRSPEQAYTSGMMPPSHPGWLSSANNSKTVTGMGRSWGSRSAGGMNGNGGRDERHQMPHHLQQQDQRQHYQQQDHQHHSAQDPPSVPPGFEQS